MWKNKENTLRTHCKQRGTIDISRDGRTLSQVCDRAGMAATASPLGTGQPASLSQTIYDVEPVRLHGVSVRGTEESRGPMAEEENEGPGVQRERQ